MSSPTENAPPQPADEPRPVDILAVMPHRDDAELLCGGTLARAVDRGHAAGVLDLTRGERGTRGSAERRAAEAEDAARALGLTARANAGLADAGLHNDDESRRRIVRLLRAFRPRVVLLPWRRGRHPDHRVGSELARDACYLAGLEKYGEGQAHRPEKLAYALAYREDPVEPTFVVDVTEQFDRKMEAVRCYGSQFDGARRGGEIHPTGRSLYERVETELRHYGSLIRRPYGEPFWTEETMRVDDPVGLGVATM
jgi:bacillithiol biosynthesis deacetylase BshB1